VNSNRPTLAPALGVFTTMMIVVGGTIGSGIFRKSGVMAAEVGSPGMLLAVWVLAGVITLCGVLVNAEIASFIPETGGQYVYFERMYGPFFAFLYGWAAFAVIQSGSVAALAYVFAEYTTTFVPLPELSAQAAAWGFRVPFVGDILPFREFWIKMVAVAVILLLTVVNYLGVRFGGAVQNLFSVAKIAGMAALFVAVFLPWTGGSAENLSRPSPSLQKHGLPLIIAIAAALQGAFWAYDGWVKVSFVAGEVRNPQRVVPRASVLGMLIVSGIYVLMNVGYCWVLPIDVMAQSRLVAADAAERVFSGGGKWIALIVIISTFSANNAVILSSARVYFAMAQRRVFPGLFSRVHPRFQTPAGSLGAQAAWSILLVFSGTFDMLTDTLIFVAWIFYAAGAYGIFVLRRKEPNQPRPFRMPGYPWAPALFVVSAAIFLGLTLYNDFARYNALRAAGKPALLQSVFGLGLVLIGAPIYFYYRRLRVIAPMLCLIALPCSAQSPLNVPAGGKPGFTQVGGINFSNALSDATVAKNQIYLLGSGIALGDVDGDGRCDIYACSLEGSNALFRNIGNWKFEDITAQSPAIACGNEFSTGTALADLDGDHDLDLLVNGIGAGTRCFLNDGKGQFSEHPESGFVRRFAATSLALADIEGDGDLDVYVANYRTTTIRSTGLQVMVVNGRRMLRPEDREGYSFTPEGLILEHGEPDFLYVNDGKANFSVLSWGGGHFRDEDGKALTAAPKDWSLSVMFRDMNGDRAPDLYICNDFQSPDRIWLNDGKGGFDALPRNGMRKTSTFSMGVDFADLDHDGHDDFLVLDMLSRDHARRMRQRAMAIPNSAEEQRPQVERNTLFRNRGDGTYAEMAYYSGLHASEWSWGIVFLDVDLDGDEDALITTGHGFDTQDSDTEKRITARGKVPNEKVGDKILLYPRLHIPNVAFRNRGDWTFEEAGAAWGFNQVGVSHGIATADLDSDGDLDVVVNNLNAPLGLFRNNSSAPRIAVRAKEIGAKICLSDGQSQEVIAGGRYLSSDDPLRVFAASKPLDIEVTWRDGKVSTVKQAEPNRLYAIDKSQSSSPPQKHFPKITPIFKEVPGSQKIVVEDLLATKYADFLKRFPDVAGVAFSDVTGDRSPDCIMARHWEALTIFENKDGNFVDATARLGLKQHIGFWNGVTTADFDGDGRLDIAASNWGRNTPHNEFVKAEWRGWFSEGGELIVEAYVNPKNGRLVPAEDLDSLSAKIPSVLERFSTSAAYGDAPLDQILGPELSKLRARRVRWLDSTVFLNCGDHFEARPLPMEAQLAPSFGLCAADIDHDRHQDLFLAQNYFGRTERHDAGRSVWLKGDGRGNFKALSSQQSGIAIYGEARYVAARDVNNDGSVDLIVDDKVYQNTLQDAGAADRRR
jgi:basic amino acid/polyamine antiporter, APA family